MKVIEVKTKRKVEFVDITETIREMVSKSRIENGICIIFVPHTTAGITVNENYDPNVTRDIIENLRRNVPDKDDYKHLEGNSPAHIKSTLVGHSLTLIINEGEIVLGRWQGIFLCEFDGPRRRKIFIETMGEQS
ncbi:MAG: YjbQ family protein [Candidatus Methanomethylicota archaeon]|nr:MAG: YjbQ family protein [Candidatus Verstraetearchaeota archaeon]